jgi:hypothetical protein
MRAHARRVTEVLFKRDWTDESTSCRLYHIDLAFLVRLQLVPGTTSAITTVIA